MITESVHFSISGEFITEHFRTLVAEGNWRDGLDGLRNSFGEEMTLDLTLDILSGKKKLTGVNDLTVEDDDVYLDEDWLDDQYYVYFNNTAFHSGKLYEAYAVVETLNIEDMRSTKPDFRADWEDVKDGTLNNTRALVYANDPDSDIVKYYNGLGWVLFEEKRTDFPIWFTKQDVKDRLSEQGAPSMLTRINASPTEDNKDTHYEDTTRDSGTDMVSNYLKNQEMVEDVLEDLDGLKERITKQADAMGGWLELRDGDKTYTLPKNAFYRWCLGNSSAYESVEWTAVSPKGMKMGMDDPNHTDWWLFTGYTLDQSYDNEISDFFTERRYEVQVELTNHEFVTLLRGQVVDDNRKRYVRHINQPTDVNVINKDDVVVIPTASPDYEQVAHKCVELGAVLVTETGGKLCHLATIGREFGLTLLLKPDARQLFPVGCSVVLSVENGEIHVQEIPIEQAMNMKMCGLL